MSNQVLVALGSNLPGADGQPSHAVCRQALAALGERPGLHLLTISYWYRTRPVPASDQPDYVNGVARFESALEPPALLAILQAEEDRAGRTRSVPNAARVLDLDLLAVGDRVVRSESLVLPHPRLQDRAFVLLPLCDVAPEWRHPVLGRTAAELCRAVPADGVARLRR